MRAASLVLSFVNLTSVLRLCGARADASEQTRVRIRGRPPARFGGHKKALQSKTIARL